MDVLVFADEPDFAAEIILRLEEAGNFNVFPIDGCSLAGDLPIPSGDAAVIASDSDTKKTAELLTHLEQIGVPAVFVGDRGRAEAKHLPNLSAPDDYSALSSLLGILEREKEAGRFETPSDILPVSADPDDVADKP